MQWKSYEAPSIPEAMAMIRREMGEDAVILSTNRKGRSFEVVAARDGDTMPVLPISQETAGRTEKKWVPEGRSQISELQEAVTALLDIVGAGCKADGDNLAPVYYQLIAAGISKPAACKFIQRMRDTGITDVYAALSNALPANKKRKRIRALVGPTGAGKTTTLAKLAAETAFAEKRRTAIITTDTHRIAATEQIKIYAKIMDIPMAVATDIDSYVKAVDRFADRDVIYVDTPGRSHGDQDALVLLNNVLRSCEDTEASLVMSVTSTREHLFRAVKQYGLFDITNIIFSKLDECTSYGVMYDIIDKTGIPVSYLTMGQNVPEDIERAMPERIAELIIGR